MKPRYSRYFTYIQPILKIPIIKSYATPIINIIALTVFIVFAIKPTIETILVLQKKLYDSNQVLIKLKQKEDNLSQAKTNYQNLDLSLKSKIQNEVPTKVDLKGITLNLESIAQANNASISALQVQPFTEEVGATNNRKLDQITFTYNLEGSYSKLLDILNQLQHSTRLISIESVVINKVEDSSNLLIIISGKAYYLK